MEPAIRFRNPERRKPSTSIYKTVASFTGRRLVSSAGDAGDRKRTQYTANINAAQAAVNSAAYHHG